MKTIIKTTLGSFFASLLLIASAQASSNNSISASAQESVAAIHNNTGVKKAFAVFEQLEPQTQQDHITLTEIPAPPFHEEKRAKAYAEMLRKAGADSVEIDGLGNVIALRKGTVGKKTIAIAAHMDTVFPVGTDVTVKVEGKKLSAPGIGDNTRGMVVGLTVLRGMAQANIRTKANVLFIGTLGEEGLGDLRGTKYLFKKGKHKIDTFIAIDGGDLDRVVYSGIGSYRYKVTFAGKGGHSWGAFGHANPHHALGRAIALFDDVADKVTSSGVKTSYNIGRIGGGTSINSIPFESWMEVDMRSRSVEKLDEVDAVFKKAMKAALAEENAAKRGGTDLTLDIKKVGERPVAIGNAKAPLIQHVLAALKQENIDARLTGSSTDSNIPISIGVPAVTLSRGGTGKHGHAPSESWENTDGPLAMRVVLTTLLAEAGLSQ